MDNKNEKNSIISIEYKDKSKRDERKTSGEHFVFLDISQKLFMQVQRGEKASLLLDAMGTWRNSFFLLIGQCLYINFHLYNEQRPLDPETELEKNFLRIIYSIKGRIPSHIISCSPAGVMKKGDSWQVVRKGTLVLEE